MMKQQVVNTFLGTIILFIAIGLFALLFALTKGAIVALFLLICGGWFLGDLLFGE